MLHARDPTTPRLTAGQSNVISCLRCISYSSLRLVNGSSQGVNMSALSMILLFFATESPGLAVDYALWKNASANKDGTWTVVAEKEVRAQGLQSLEPRDMATFCPAYTRLSTDDRI